MPIVALRSDAHSPAKVRRWILNNLGVVEADRDWPGPQAAASGVIGVRAGPAQDGWVHLIDSAGGGILRDDLDRTQLVFHQPGSAVSWSFFGVLSNHHAAVLVWQHDFGEHTVRIELSTGRITRTMVLPSPAPLPEGLPKTPKGRKTKPVICRNVVDFGRAPTTTEVELLARAIVELEEDNPAVLDTVTALGPAADLLIGVDALPGPVVARSIPDAGLPRHLARQLLAAALSTGPERSELLVDAYVATDPPLWEIGQIAMQAAANDPRLAQRLHERACAIVVPIGGMMLVRAADNARLHNLGDAPLRHWVAATEAYLASVPVRVDIRRDVAFALAKLHAVLDEPEAMCAAIDQSRRGRGTKPDPSREPLFDRYRHLL